MELTDDDVLEILKLFERSQFDFLQLEQGERKITVSKGGFVSAAVGASAAPTRSAAAAVPIPAAPSTLPARSEPPQAAPKQAAADAGLLPIPAPMVGKFYASPSPADPAYVEVGTKVAAGATIGLIEVMKVFASIKSETAGVIEKILVSSGEFVEAGQTIFLIRPER